jgi:hypothetical protein
MRALRCFSLSSHAVVELVTGLVLVIAGLALDLGTAGTISVFVAGVLMAGLGFGTADSMPLTAHRSLDRALATTLAAAAVGVAATGAPAAAALLLVAGAVELALGAVTQWRRAPLAR